jgi:hypothetical protein
LSYNRRMKRKIYLALFLSFITWTAGLTGCAPSFMPPEAVHFIDGLRHFLLFPLVLFGMIIYLSPIVIAALRRKQNLAPLLLVNILLGWTVIGWIICVIWAFSEDNALVPRS